LDSSRADLKAAAHDAPDTPGCYLWRDDEGRIIYIGKAKSLRNRLKSYFSGDKDIKTATLIRNAATIETIIVTNEYEALLLENTLIKQHRPKYNINLKDGKTYPVVRISSGDYPKVFRTRHIIEDGSRYFGPFPNTGAIDTMLAMIEKRFPLRKCKSVHNTLRKRDTPCMYYHIGRCAAPCCGKITQEEYAVHVEHAAKLLAGETEALLIDLRVKMHEAAIATRYEDAASCRDAIRDIESLAAGNTVVDFDTESRDYIAQVHEGVLTTLSVFSMRGGRLTSRDLYRTRSAAAQGESLETFIVSYYNADRPPPAKIYVEGTAVSGTAPEDALARYFHDHFGYQPMLLAPDEKKHEAALAMARQNALEDMRKRLKERGAGPALDELMQALGLKRRPVRIEGFDIAQLDGKHPVASLISFRNGIPDRKNYRLFKLRSVIGVVDDFAAMREAVRRRYTRLLRENADLPDLVLIDGGIGQVNAAKGVLDELGMDTDVAGLAKRDEEIWLPSATTLPLANAPIRLSRRSDALKVLQAVRDETHRFATTLNQKLRSKDLKFPVLESIDGIGAKRAAAIMKAFGSLAAIAAAPAEDVARRTLDAAHCSLTLPQAEAVRTAARLAVEDQAAERKRLAQNGSASDTARDDIAAALAAEASAVYDDDVKGG
jgi:excinuclease ABC subunit C